MYSLQRALFRKVFRLLLTMTFWKTLGRECRNQGIRGEELQASKHNGESGFEELIPGFGGSSQPQQQKWRVPLESNHDPSIPSSSMPDPFADLGTTTPAHQSHQSYDDPLKNISGSMNSQSTNTNSFVTGFSFADFMARKVCFLILDH
ncbi:hypothetical protein HPP92_010409 [Vanilla planifolia]|uniref:Uncharacterized protein n=1 Tax=Vanilla planifolia TaxID=51239 RepID=A0A835R6E6_VANPL|nr:hypothetical protein HPP92_010409 [Vanilla planifolia]